MRHLALLSLLLLACSSTEPTPTSRSGGLIDWTARPPAPELEAFRTRARPFLQPESRPCLAALLREHPDLGHAWWLDTQDPATHNALAQAWEAAGVPAYRASSPLQTPAHRRARETLAAALQARDPDLAQDAHDAFADLDDPVRAAEAALLAAALLLQRGDTPTLPESVTPAQHAWRALLDVGLAWRQDADVDAAFARATTHDDWTTLRRLEALRELGVGVPPNGRAWSHQLAQAALQRGDSLEALRYAARAAVAGQSPERRLLARAHLQAGRLEAAAVEAETALEQAANPTEEAAATGLEGEILQALQRAEPAAEHHTRARELTEQPQERARHTLNAAAAWLQAGRPEHASELLDTCDPQGPLRARLQIIRALVDLMKGRANLRGTAQRIDAALLEARAAGHYHVVEQYDGLPNRLRQRAS